MASVGVPWAWHTQPVAPLCAQLPKAEAGDAVNASARTAAATNATATAAAAAQRRKDLTVTPFPGPARETRMRTPVTPLDALAPPKGDLNPVAAQTPRITQA